MQVGQSCSSRKAIFVQSTIIQMRCFAKNGRLKHPPQHWARLRPLATKVVVRGRVARRGIQGCRAVSAPSQQSTKSSGGHNRPKVVILGSGWGAISFIKALPKDIGDKYDITMISPRNYFLFTALLPAAAFGNVEPRSIIESNRKLIHGKGSYLEAACTNIDVDHRTIGACFPRHAGLAQHCFTLPYDMLIVATGSINNTFGIKGVKENAFFFKSIEDATALRQRVCECFERAALPDTTPEEASALLTFVIVGGGPTGVEVAAELHDLIAQDLARYYDDLGSRVARVMLVELGDHVLSTYDRAISEYTSNQFQRDGIQLVLNSRVSSIRDRHLTVINAQGEKQGIAFGACCWATGVAMHPLVKHLQGQLPSQSHWRSIVTDPHLRVLGSGGAIWALGDAATQDQPRALERADELFERADVDKDGVLTLAELQALMTTASKEFGHLSEHARFLAGRMGFRRWGGLVADKLQVRRDDSQHCGLEALGDDCQVTREQFTDILATVDKGLRALPATGVVAAQQGTYLAKLFASHSLQSGLDLHEVEPFRYRHSAATAYVGNDRAVFGPFTGLGAGMLWRGFETYRQISFRNQCLVVGDFIKTKVFGRDVEFGLAEEDLSMTTK